MNRCDFLVLGGTAIALPLVARAQQRAAQVVGYLHFGSSGPFAYQVAAFQQGLREIGYIDGQNVVIEYRWAEGKYDRLPTLAANLVGLRVEVIAAFGPPSAQAAKMRPRRSQSFSTSVPIQLGMAW